MIGCILQARMSSTRFPGKIMMTVKNRPIIDYVITHELCHVIEPNHSKSFWSLVKSYDPDYKKKDKWLKINGNPIILF